MSYRSHRTATPKHWIGVFKGWQSVSENPLDCLVSLPPHQLRTHSLVLGATGSGKTNLLHHMIAQDLMLGHPFAVLDMRGDLVSATLEMCSGSISPSKVFLLDLRDKGTSVGFDPLAGKGEPYFRALSVLDIIATESESWGVQLAETLRNALLLLAEVGEPLTRLESLFYDRQFRASCLDACRSESMVAFWHRFDDMPSERQATMAMPVMNKVSLLLATPAIRKILGHPSPIDLGAHLNVPGCVTLVSLAVDQTHGAGRMMGRLAFSSICRELFSRIDIPEAKRNPVRLYVDEFENFASEEFEAILAEGRRFGLSLVLAHQTLAQLSTRMRSMILNNVGVKVVFHTGREDGATMSRDLTGDPRGIDFSQFRRGECLLWRREVGAIPVEINEPFLHHGSSLSRQARTFADEIDGNGPAFRIQRTLRPLTMPPGPQRQSQVRVHESGRNAMEDWL